METATWHGTECYKCKEKAAVQEDMQEFAMHH